MAALDQIIRHLQSIQLSPIQNLVDTAEALDQLITGFLKNEQARL